VARGRPDAIHVHGTRLRQAWVIDWAHARGIPTVYTEHVTLDERAGAVDAAAIATMRERLGAMACVSERSRTSLQATLGAAHPVAVMRHVVDGPADELMPASTTAAGVGDKRPLAIVCVARLEQYKGIDVLLRALALVQSRGSAVTALILGDGAERAALEALARSLDLRHVEFVGAVPPEAVSPALLAADLMVLPSRGEGLPLAIVEAMAHGRPVLATRVGGNAEVVVEGVTGLLVDPERPYALADAIVELAASPERLQAMGAAARRAWAEGAWSPIHVVAQARALYAQAAARFAGAGAGASKGASAR
jgi:glycosyltransferase involved in cell wall biosynthesis